MDDIILQKAREWAETAYFSESFRNEIKALIKKNDEAELTDRFYKDLEFGTGGLRGVLGAGSNRMNIYTVRKATQGLADYLLEWSAENKADPSVAIAFDSRRKSDEFSREAACVLAANGITVHRYTELRPVPMLSFAVRELGTTAGIVITASHNPPEYNGYKVYWSDGCQIISPHDKAIIEKANAIESFSAVSYMDYDDACNQGLIWMIPESLEESYFDRVESLCLGHRKANSKLGIVFTPLHGAGNYPVREMLKRRGFENVRIVASQEKADGDFPTVTSPNPEEPTALQIAKDTAVDSDELIIGTDPDADRIGVLVRHQGEWHKINGNQIGQLLLDYYLSKLKENQHLPQNGVYITTIVTSTLGQEIADSYNIRTIETLTGFKYIGSVIRELETENRGSFIFGTEESHGYLLGKFVRDKDGVIASTIFAEMCAELQQKGLTAVDQLDKIHRRYSYHTDSLVTKVFKGHIGAMKIRDIMSHLRRNPPDAIAGIPVVLIKDYDEKRIIDRISGELKGETEQPRSNVLAFYMKDGSRITARPSGTEPKIKFYFNLKGDDYQKLQETKQEYVKDFERRISIV